MKDKLGIDRAPSHRDLSIYLSIYLSAISLTSLSISPPLPFHGIMKRDETERRRKRRKGEIKDYHPCFSIILPPPSSSLSLSHNGNHVVLESTRKLFTFRYFILLYFFSFLSISFFSSFFFSFFQPDKNRGRFIRRSFNGRVNELRLSVVAPFQRHPSSRYSCRPIARPPLSLSRPAVTPSLPFTPGHRTGA